MSDAISFSEFGPLFFQALLTQELLTAKLKAAIPLKIYIADQGFKGSAEFLGLSAPPALSHDLRELRFHASLGFKINISWAGGDVPQITVSLPLLLAFECHESLTLFVRMPAVQQSDCQFTYDSHNPLSLLIIKAIESNFVGQLNLAICESASDRIIDVASAILESTTGPANASNQIVISEGSQSIVAPGVAVIGEVSPGKTLRGTILLRQAESIRFMLYGQLASASALVGSHGATAQFSFTREKHRDEGSESLSVQYDAWGDCFARSLYPGEIPGELPGWYVAPETGRYVFKLSTEAGSDHILAKILHLRRFKAVNCEPEILAKLPRVDFGQFAISLMQQGLNAEFLQRRIESALTDPGLTAKLSFQANLPVLGQTKARLNLVLDKVPVQITGDTTSKEVVWQLSSWVTATVHCEHFGDLEIRCALKPKIALITTADPSIEVILKQAAVDLAFNFPSALTTLILEKSGIEAWLGQQINTMLGLLVKALPPLVRVPIWQIADGILKATPSHGDSNPFGADLSTGGTLRPGQTQDLAMHLNAYQHIEIIADVMPKASPGYVGANVFLAICDEGSGILDSNTFIIAPGKPRKHNFGLKFTAPAGGTYHARIRCHPAGGEDFEFLNYHLNVK